MFEVSTDSLTNNDLFNFKLRGVSFQVFRAAISTVESNQFWRETAFLGRKLSARTCLRN